MSSSHGALIVFGSGPGIGRSTAIHFAQQGFKYIILLSRNASKLSEDAEAVKKAASEVDVYTATIDLASDEGSIRKVLEHDIDKYLEDKGIQAEVVLYNGARIGASKFFEFERETLEEDLRITTLSLYTVLSWAIPQLRSSSYSTPAFLVTSGDLYKSPEPLLFSLSAAKAAQFNLVHSAHKAFEPDVRIALVVVKGVVKDDAKVTSAKNVAGEFWGLYAGTAEGKGQVSVDMVDPGYERDMAEMKKAMEGAK